MTINRNNYELFIIDYIDGRLSPELTDEFMAFLNQNPDIAHVIDGIADIKVTPTPVKAPFAKETLKRTNKLPELTLTEADYLCIAELENELTAEEASQLKELKKKNPDISKLSTTYSKTKLKAETKPYPKKDRLKHIRIIPTYARIAMAIASVAAVLLIAFHVNNLMVNMNRNNLVTEQQPTPIVTEHHNNPSTEKKVAIASGDGAVTKPKPKTSVKLPKHNVATEKIQTPEPTTDIAIKEEAIEPMVTIEPQVTQITQQEPQSDININSNINLSGQNVATANRVQSKTKELTLGDIALKGIQKIAQTVGFNIEVKQIDDNKAKKIVVESKLLAVSATILPKEE